MNTTTILFVSCFVKIYETIPNERTTQWRINYFKSLLKTGINILLFISPEFEKEFKFLRLIYPNLKYQLIDIATELSLFSNRPTTPKLPDIRNESKDTYEYMALMNSKLDFIKKAIDHHPPHTHYAWIDFNIPYIFKEPDFTFSFLSFLSKQQLNSQFLYIPGCWDKIDTHQLITYNVLWRFCGGFFIGDKNSILDFFHAVKYNVQDQLIDKSVMVWETNLWAFLESTGKWIPSHWVHVNDHDDTMITRIPTELYITPLTWSTNRSFDESTILPKIDGFHSSSISYNVDEKTKGEYLVCRMINYRLSSDGRQYIYSSQNTIIENINNLINLSNKSTRQLTLSSGAAAHYINEHVNCFSRGLEDIRIYPDMTFSANSVSLTNGKNPQIIYGKINTVDATIYDMKHIQSPRGEHECEKNWIFIAPNEGIIYGHNVEKYVIYRWYPYEIAVLNNDKIEIVGSFNLTPQYLFRNMRGSTIFTNCNINGVDWLIGVVHYSMDQPTDSPIVRKYYHCLVLLNPTTLIPTVITSPFTFCEKHGIEFCIGMKYDETVGMFTFWVSIMDESPREFYIHKSQLKFNIIIGYTKN
jgi:hypothetical protein